MQAATGTRRRGSPWAFAMIMGLTMFAPGGALAQSTPAPTPSPPPPAAPSPAPSETPTPTPSPAPSADSGQIIELVARPAACVEGKANREEVYVSIQASLATARGELDKVAIKPAARPIAVFLEADDNGFVYRAEIPVDAIPEGKTSLSPAVKFCQTPVGKSMRFEHRGAYDDIDATYEAITAYLDEKGVDAQDVFVEEYLNDVKTTDDPNLQVDIFVLLK